MGIRRRPDVINDISLEKIDDSTLHEMFLSTRSEIRRQRRQRNNTKSLEMDMCYIQNEIKTRHLKDRRTLEYMKIQDKSILGKTYVR